MKLPSGMEIKDETLSEMAAYLAVDMVANEYNYSDSFDTLGDALSDGYEGGFETLDGMEDTDISFIYDLLTGPTIDYANAIRRSLSRLFNQHLKNKKWEVNK
jgi:hypothetical protein